MVDINTHAIMATELSASNVTDGEVLPNLLKQTHQKINEILSDSVYDTVRIKRVASFIPLRKG
ncbi:hypothetical protein BTN50_0573 [Candidatus Enterovibrio altilux]|uniref:Mobile element protein n=1 Tax=Candidatus Enterovibrio altilux TaxID=1927128 RepID=A0A291B7Y4_9GAMM|nr:hypothetical protein BTN50_0573 [Candidatus Enterovibrio luxaltus]